MRGACPSGLAVILALAQILTICQDYPVFSSRIALSRKARVGAGLLGLLAGVALALQIVSLMLETGQGLGAVLSGAFSREFPALTAIIIIVTYGAVAFGIGARKGPRRFVTAVTCWTMFMSIMYHFYFVESVQPVMARRLSDLILHSLVPILMILWWVSHGRTERLGLRDLPLFLLWPALYTAYVLARGGLVDGVYPYVFLDPTIFGVAGIARNIGVLVATVLLPAGAMVALSRIKNA